MQLPQAVTGARVSRGARAGPGPAALLVRRRHSRRCRGGPARGLPHDPPRQRWRDRVAPAFVLQDSGPDRRRSSRGGPAHRHVHARGDPGMSTEWASARNLLCIRLDNMGDVLMTTPAMKALRESAPGRRLTLLASASGTALAPHLDCVDDAIRYDAPWVKQAPGPEGYTDLATVGTLSARRFDAAVIFTVYSQSALPAAFLCRLAGIPRVLAHCRENPYALVTDWVRESEPDDQVRHETQRQLDLVAQ